jgi:hypothetical protein
MLLTLFLLMPLLAKSQSHEATPTCSIIRHKFIHPHPHPHTNTGGYKNHGGSLSQKKKIMATTCLPLLPLPLSPSNPPRPLAPPRNANRSAEVGDDLSSGDGKDGTARH